MKFNLILGIVFLAAGAAFGAVKEIDWASI
jgi:hypothetical protein